MFKLLEKFRKNDINLNMGIAQEKRFLPFLFNVVSNDEHFFISRNGINLRKKHQ